MKTFIITESGQLDALLNKNKKLRFELNLNFLTPIENQFWHKKLNISYNACGCDLGAKFVVYSSLFILSLFILGYYFLNREWRMVDYIFAITFIFSMAGLGKILGKANAYKKLLKNINHLKRREFLVPVL